MSCLVQLRGHGSHSELGEVEGSRRYLKVLLAEDNLINMKVLTHTLTYVMNDSTTLYNLMTGFIVVERNLTFIIFVKFLIIK